jgi:4-hydroxybenzoate polyprenyltransferase
MINWYFGWGSILLAFLSGAAIGVFFYSEDFLGGYASFRRRILRLGHIALAALGTLNVLFGQVYMASEPSFPTWVASLGFLVGGLAMPLICFLSAWRVGFRHLFFIPVIALVIAAVQTLRSGPP